MGYSNPNVAAQPGIGTKRTAGPPRQIFMRPEGVAFLPDGKIISGAVSRDPLNATPDYDVLRAGLLMGKITSGGKYAPSIIGVTTAAYDQDHSTDNVKLSVSVATATEIVRRIGTTGTFKLTGPPTSAGTVAVQTVTYSAVSLSTGVITISDLSADAIAGSFIQPTDGSETIKTFIPDGYGVKVTDEDKLDIDVRFELVPIAGVINPEVFINWPTDTSLIAYVKAALVAVGHYTWWDNF